ncbi:SSI family serine proteinase inhibitor [Nonomuraea sp. MCN248]|uniref:SSI family serine proteinase inhibitor n=1 Tax=Nonomuraea corallina TaxID=2989783 RepID=A0ABT4SMJ7_9ACTN|nr:SSI family serine proteinase inhibitor [Nonomuraea corallina]MDA0638469.1 SSI family serine proteinase inhibitor [Nonomuraea corallina]
MLRREKVMMKAVGALALSGALLAVAAPALARSGAPGAAQAPGASLRILIAVKDGGTREARLTCRPSGGDHRSPRRACELLQQVDGDPGLLDVHPQAVCTREYRPVSVVVIGKWRGRSVSFGRVYSNACLMKAAGGAVYTL